MKKILIFILAALFFWPASGRGSTANEVLRKVYEAQKLLVDVPIKLETKEEKWKRPPPSARQHVIFHEIALLGWDVEADTLHVIRLKTPYKAGNSGAFRFETITKGYNVERLQGRSISKLVFKVQKGDLRLVILAGKYWWFHPELNRETHYGKIMPKAKEVIYTPFAEDFYFKELAVAGSRFLFDAIEGVKQELREKEVSSRAFPEELLADAIPGDLIFNLGLSEQMDHGKFISSAEKTADEVAIEYALNLANAFGFSVSAAGARGAYQFTNRSRRGRAGTYDIVVSEYAEAELIEDFPEGSQYLPNMIKAAICLIDKELAAFPEDVRRLFKENYRLGGIYPVAAYNEGWGGAIQLYQWIKKNGYILNLGEDILSSAFWRTGRKYNKKTKKFVRGRYFNSETDTFLKKQRFLWTYIDSIKEQLK